MPDKYTYATPDPYKILQDRILDLERRMRQVEPGIYPEDWHNIGNPGEPAFENGWTNSGGGLELAGYMRDEKGFVYLRGVVTGGTIPSVIWTMPVAYRPVGTQNYRLLVGTGGGTLEIAISGTVSLTVGTGSPTYIQGVFYRLT